MTYLPRRPPSPPVADAAASACATEDPPRPVGIQQWRYPVDGQQMPGMDAMLEQMQNLPADQRRMMEEMLAAQE